LADPTQTVADTIPVFEESGQKRLKVTTLKASTTVALGNSAGRDNQSEGGVAIGPNAAYNQQGLQSVAVGSAAGAQTQGYESVAVGYLAGQNNQKQQAVAIGGRAGLNNQGARSIAIGWNCSADDQAPESIAINATGNAITANQQGGFFVAPVRDLNTDVSGKVMCYNVATKEVVLQNQPTSTTTKAVFDLDGTLSNTFYDDAYISFTWNPAQQQVGFVAKAPLYGVVNVGQHLTRVGTLLISGGKFSVTTETTYWFSGDGTEDSTMLFGVNGNHCKMWLSGGSGGVGPHYTIDLMGGARNQRLFGVVHRYDH
jgi:hypothetical protein